MECGKLLETGWLDMGHRNKVLVGVMGESMCSFNSDLRNFKFGNLCLMSKGRRPKVYITQL